MAMHSDDEEHDAHYTNGVNRGLPSPFMLNDDAFDEDDIDVPEFSPAAIRKELANNMNAYGAADHGWGLGGAATGDDLDNIAAKIGYSVDPDASVSTFDIDGPPDSPPSVSPPRTPPPSMSRMDSLASFRQDSLYDVPLSSEPSQEIPLSENDSPPAPQYEEPEEMPADYPAVQIDLSVPHAEAREMHTDSRSSVETTTSAHSHTTSSASRPTPHHQHSVSQHEFRTRSPPTSLKIDPAHPNAASTSALPLPLAST